LGSLIVSHTSVFEGRVFFANVKHWREDLLGQSGPSQALTGP